MSHKIELVAGTNFLQLNLRFLLNIKVMTLFNFNFHIK